jgi:hypothetical protein
MLTRSVSVPRSAAPLYLDPPAEVLDEFGFVQSEYVSDMLHGNFKYGAALIRQVGEILPQSAG